jgi:hypothetical protein
MSSQPHDPAASRRPQRLEASAQWVAAWEGLLERQPHLRHPEAAAHALRIPEAGLMALRHGQDSTRLAGQATQWLQPIAQWGPLAITVQNRLGAATVHIPGLAARSQGDQIQLSGENLQVLLANRAAAHGFLLEDRSAPSAQHSLHLYDPAGEPLLRISLLTEAGAREALAHLLAHADFQAGTGWRSGSIGSEAVSGFPGWCAIVSTINRMDAARRAMISAVGRCTELPQLRFTLEAKAVALQYLGPVVGYLNSAPSGTPAGCVFTARATTANHGFVCLSPDNVSYLRFHDTEASTATFWPVQGGLAARAWVDAVIQPGR